MNPIIIKCQWLLDFASWINGFKVEGIEYIPFIVIVDDLDNKVLIRHETIHFKQMLELLIVFWYVWYIAHYLVNLVKYRNHEKAYMNIIFEKEAYNNMFDKNYLKNRKFWGFIR